MVRYYKLFDMLNRRGMKKSDLREILSPKTVAKLSKGEYLSGEVIEKICVFMNCQPGDIMEIVETEENRPGEYMTTKSIIDNSEDEIQLKKETFIEDTPPDMSLGEADAERMIKRDYVDNEDTNN